MAVEWDEIEEAAKGIFNVWTSAGDLVFAKECWGHLAAAGRTDDDGVVTKTETYLRLVALRLIYGEFCAAKWDENAETGIAHLVEDLEIDGLALGLLASPHIEDEGLWYANEYDLREAALIAAVEGVRTDTFECIRNAYGGQTGLYQRLSQTAGNDDRHDDSDLEPTGNNLDAFEFAAHGRR